jgi:mono/diheme cytochrome c family protein
MIRIVVVALVLAAGPARAQDLPERGMEIAETNCAPCHGVGREGASPLAAAPPFRELGRRYPVGDLEEALVEGIVTAHPDMPEFQFDPADAAALIAYLETIQDP